MTQIQVTNSSGNVIKNVDIQDGKTILWELERADVEIPNACRTWMCGACMCTIVSWEDQIVKDFRGEPAFPLGENEVMTCIAWIKETDEKIILQTLD